jgi:hypothetical protein
MNDLLNVRQYFESDPTALLRLQLLAVLALSLIVPLLGLLLSYLREHIRGHGGPSTTR